MSSVSRFPPLSSLRAFEAVVRRASFKAAAGELSVTPSAISHQIRQLEAHVGVRLVDRPPGSVGPTTAGTLLHEATSSGFDLIRQAIGRIRTPPETKALTLTSTAAFLSHWLVPRLASLQSALPEVVLRFHASNLVEDLRPGGIDVAIRYGRGPFAGSESRKLFDDAFIPVCSPALGLSHAQDLRYATLIHVEGRNRPDPAPTWERWCAMAGLPDIDARAGPRLPDSMSAVQAAIAGQGVVIVSRLLAGDAIAAGLLMQPFAHAIPGDAYHFVTATDVAQDENIAALRNWFVAEFAETSG